MFRLQPPGDHTTLKKHIISFILVLAAALTFVPTVTASSRLPHYIYENKTRYEEFQAANPDISFDKIIAYVNVNVDKGFYENIKTIKEPGNITVLVNKNFSLPGRYIPDDLTDIGGGHKMRAEAAEQFIKMKKALNDQGLPLYVRSSYRSYSSQTANYNRIKASDGSVSADRQTARAGHSEHQTGLAVDVLQRAGNNRMTTYRFQDTRQYAWMLENAHKYGFICRYPDDLTGIHGYIFEPWHWRYIGVEAATTMYNENITLLEEYHGRYLTSLYPPQPDTFRHGTYEVI